MGVGHWIRVKHSQLREHAKRGTGLTHKLAQAVTGEAPRSPHWPTIEKRWKKEHPDCAACGSGVHVQVHHKESFKLDPALELHDGTDLPPATPPPDGKPNFISLCMSDLECHLKLGHPGPHGFHGGGYNPKVEEHAAAMSKVLAGISSDLHHLLVNAEPPPAIQAIWDEAASCRIG